MKKHRFISAFDLSKKKIQSTDKEIIDELKNVLHLKAGNELILGDGKGKEADAIVSTLHNKLAEIEISEVRKNQNEPPIEGTLYLAILKAENFELVAKKTTEIGIKKIQPIITERTVKQNVRSDRLEKIIREAAQSSGRGILPTANDPIPFEEAVKEASDNDGNFFFDQDIKKERPHDARIVDSAGIFVGPEGGWSDKERELAERFRFHFVSLGNLRLREETAAIIATHLALYGGMIE